MEDFTIFPRNEEAEVSVLGSILLDYEASSKHINSIHSTYFFKKPHIYIFRAIKSLHEKGIPVDVVTVKDQLITDGKLEEAGGVYYITGLKESTPSAASIKYYINIIKEKHELRNLIMLGQEVRNTASDQNKSSDEILSYISDKVFESRTNTDSTNRLIINNQIVNERKSGLITRVAGFDIGSGYSSIDTFLSSAFDPKQLSIICGRPAQGKTAYKENIQKNQCESGVGVFSITPEMGFDAEMDRFTSILTGIPLMEIIRMKDWVRVNNGKLISENREKLSAIKEAAKTISNWNLHFLDGSISFSDIHQSTMEIKRRHDIKVVFIDLFDRIIEIDRAVKNRPDEISKGLNYIERIAKELNVHFCLLVQLNRDLGKRKDKRPTLFDLKGSGGWEEKAWTIFGVHRESEYDSNIPDDVMEIIIMKQRQGPKKIIELNWDNKTTTLTEELF